MNWIHVHLALNHVPVLGPAFIAVFYVAALVARHRGAQRFCLWTLVAVAVVTVPIKFTGEWAAGARGELPEAERPLVTAHEAAGDQATTTAFLLGLAAAAALFVGRRDREMPRFVHGVVLIFLLGNFALMLRAANTGGLIRHPEIRETVSQE